MVGLVSGVNSRLTGATPMEKDNRVHYRKLRDQALEHLGVKIENQNPQYPVAEELNGLFERNADSHRESFGRGKSGPDASVREHNDYLRDGAARPPRR
jgi:hypothetical protein